LEQRVDINRLRQLLEEVQGGNLAINDALDRLKRLPFDDLGFAKIDHHRSLRKNFPEVIYGAGKTPEQVVRIVEGLLEAGSPVVATRSAPEIFAAVQRIAPHARYYEVPRMIVIQDEVVPRGRGTVLVLSAGTSDLPVAEEAAMTAEVMANKVERIYDCGVAGLHRLLANQERLHAASVIIAVAGMDGALPSVVGGLVAKPVIAVPTSVGYGASFGGLAALLTMLNSCAPGVAVVNIDNGFGAGYLASMLNQQ
jgi:NCAIR mutase (PurE)-related protein